MSCCDQQGRAPIAPVTYVLPDAAPLAAPGITALPLPAASANGLFVSRDPLYPPPRA